ncbi:uncharacterized protein N7487_000999 [Penicillium crustosum]|uniref:uncharacterized protein n=1 Tax=Penicillium crustosum TaxID=36656 RepID=UPI002395C4BB|nr:uncharacterized protein N7487_000999 [Penicillium crustosum]KAJ5417449.1 hypothetical protein N7487_000999 [Penicillium crustosum]
MLGQLDPWCLLALFKSYPFRGLYVSYFCFCLVGFAIFICLLQDFAITVSTSDVYVQTQPLTNPRTLAMLSLC